jgi:hypothetical protein
LVVRKSTKAGFNRNISVPVACCQIPEIGGEMMCKCVLALPTSLGHLIPRQAVMRTWGEIAINVMLGTATFIVGQTKINRSIENYLEVL